MSDILIAILAILFVLGVAINIHEFGHFIVAKFFGMRVEAYSFFGLGPRLFGVKIGHTDYRVSAIPLGAYVKLYGDEWEILLTDRNTILNDRNFEITITPDDPFPAWNFFGTYLGNRPDNIVQGQSENLRATNGLLPIDEALRNFARLKISSGSRYNHLMP